MDKKAVKALLEYDYLGYDFNNNQTIKIWKNPDFNGEASEELNKIRPGEEGIRIVINHETGDLFMGEYNEPGVNDYDHLDLTNAVDPDDDWVVRGWIKRDRSVTVGVDKEAIAKAKKKNPQITDWIVVRGV